MNPLHPGFPDVTWKRLAMSSAIGFLASTVIGWAFDYGTGWLLVGGSVTVLVTGAVLFFGMRAKEVNDGPATW